MRFFDPLFLQTAKERLRHGVVPAVAAATHAGLEVMVAAEPQPVVAAVLRALIGVDQRTPWLTTPYGHQDRVDHDLAGQRRLH